MSKLSAQITPVLDKFDFAKTLRVMEFLDWTWVGGRPTVQDLKIRAHQLLCLAVEGYENSTRQEFGFSVSTGGFIAQVETFSEGPPRLQLIFYVDYAQCYSWEIPA